MQQYVSTVQNSSLAMSLCTFPQESAGRYTDSQHQINLCFAETQERHLRSGGRDPFGTARDTLPPENVQLGQQAI